MKPWILPAIVVISLLVLPACQDAASAPEPTFTPNLAVPAWPAMVAPVGTPDLQAVSIEEYLEMHVATTAFGGKAFCAYDLMGQEQDQEKVSLFLWTLCMEYYVMEERLQKGSGISVPVVIYLDHSGDGFAISGHALPPDGAGYGPGIRALFPEALWGQIFPDSDDIYAAHNARAERLEAATQQSAKIHFLLTEGILDWNWPEGGG